jgi:hypothetical protein
MLGHNHPPAKSEALRWLAPNRGLTAGKRPLTRPRPSATLSPRERGKVVAPAGPPQIAFSLSGGRGWTAPRAFTSGRGTGEGSLPGQPTVIPEDVKILLPHRQSSGISQGASASKARYEVS